MSLSSRLTPRDNKALHPRSPFPQPPVEPLARVVDPQDIVVLGAGMAGLVAAYELVRSGHRVTIIEAQDRVGGRVKTLREPFTPPLYAEAGAMFLPHHHTLTIGYATKFGLTLKPIIIVPSMYYVGEQRIVDTEGQVDRFRKRLQARADRIAEAEAREAERTSPAVPLSDFDLGKRYLTAFSDNGVNNVGDFLSRLAEGGDEALLEIPGIGRKVLSDLKKALRARGYELPAKVE